MAPGEHGDNWQAKLPAQAASGGGARLSSASPEGFQAKVLSPTPGKPLNPKDLQEKSGIFGP
jgi:hypothetical protein